MINKFKIWDKKYHKMSPGVNLKTLFEDSFIRKETSKRIDDLVFLPYTGIRDASLDHQEIYELDILKIPFHYEGDRFCVEKKAKVVFDDGEFYLEDNNGEWSSLFDAVQNYRAVVVGNIFKEQSLSKKVTITNSSRKTNKDKNYKYATQELGMSRKAAKNLTNNIDKIEFEIEIDPSGEFEILSVNENPLIKYK